MADTFFSWLVHPEHKLSTNIGPIEQRLVIHYFLGPEKTCHYIVFKGGLSITTRSYPDAPYIFDSRQRPICLVQYCEYIVDNSSQTT